MHEGRVKKVPGDTDSVLSLAVNPTLSYYVTTHVLGVSLCLMVDTGAAVSLLRKDKWQLLGGADKYKLEQWTGSQLVGVEGSPVPVYGATCVKVQMGEGDLCVSIDFLVVDSLKVESLIGIDFLEKHGCVVNLEEGVLQLKGISIPLQNTRNSYKSRVAPASLSLVETVTIPPYSELETMASAAMAGADGVWLVSGLDLSLPVLIAAAVVSCAQGREIPIRMINPSASGVTIYKGTRVAMAEEMEEWMLASITEAESAPNKNSTVTAQKQQILWQMVEQCEEDLSTEQKEQLYHLLLAYADIFADGSDELGRTNCVKHVINTGDHPPIRQPYRRIPASRGEQAHQLVQEMLQKDVIQPSSSPWASPVVLVQKKDGSYRFCVDYRKLNRITRKDAYPLPRVDDTLDALEGTKWFSTLDLLWGYWQVEVSEKDREKTAFVTRDGLFEFKVMPFGLCNAPATFQRLMDLVLAGIHWSSCLVYIDDIVIMGRTFQQHLVNLKLVLDRLRGAGLKLKPTKCSLCRKEVLFLGHRITRQGIATDPAKTAAVQKWAVPQTTQELQGFLGLVGYYRKYVSGFASIAKPLYRLTEKGREFKWTSECGAAFEELKARLMTAPILAFPDFSRTFILDTDASDVGLGAVLSQEHEGNERVVAYASRVLSKAEKRYCATRKELLAVVTFVKHFRAYLLGRHFILRTDHGSLQWLYNFREPEGQMARWLELLQEFDFEVIHRSGRCHTNADALSRYKDEGEGNSPCVTATLLAAKDSGCSMNMQQLQQEDDVIGPIHQALSQGARPNPADIKGKPREFAELVQQWDQLVLRNNVVHRRYEDAVGHNLLQIIAPKGSRSDILQQLHNGALGGHLGEAKTLSRLQERFYWPGHTDDVRMWCKNCPDCGARKSPTKKRRAPLQGVITGYPMQMVAVDITGPFPRTTNGNSYILVVSDYFTRWAEAYAIPNQEAATVADKLVEEFFCRFSIPEQLHSDQGRQFESNLMQEICKLLNIYKSRTTPYHPQSDGLVERLNRTLISMLATSVHEHSGDWDRYLRQLCMAYNTSVQSSTGFTPFFLMFGRQAKLPMDVVYGSTPTEAQPCTEYAQNLKDRLGEAYTMVREHMGSATGRQKELYDAKVHGDEFKVGDLVWLHNPVVTRGASRKLHCPWAGPYQVVKKLSTVVFRIQDVRRGRRSRKVVHFDRLKPCPSTVRFPPEHMTPKNHTVKQTAAPEYTDQLLVTIAS